MGVPMKRLLKWVLVGAGIIAVVLVGVGLWLRHQYPPERIRRLAADKLGARLGRAVDIAGADISLLHGLRLNGVKISERPDFSAGIFLEIGEISVLPRLLPLLSRKIVIHSVHFSQPRLRVERFSDGTFNFSDLAQPGPPSTGKTDTAALFISRATITNGEIHFQDSGIGLNSTLTAITLRLSAFSLANPFDLNLKGRIDIQYKNRSWQGPLELKVDVSPLGNPSIRIDTFQIGLGASTLTLTGSIDNRPAPHASLTVGVSPFAMEDAAPFLTLPPPFNSARLIGEWTVRGTTATLAVQGKGEMTTPGLKLAAAISGESRFQSGDHTYSIQPKAIYLEKNTLDPNLSVTGLLSGGWTLVSSRGRWTLAGETRADQASLTYGGWLEKTAGDPFTLTGSVEQAVPAPQFFFDLRAPTIQIASPGPWPKEAVLAGEASFAGECRGNPSNMKFTVTADAAALDLAYKDLLRKKPASPLGLTAQGQIRDFEEILLTSAAVRTALGEFEIQGRIGNLFTQRRYDISVNNRSLPLNRLAPLLPLLGSYQLKGTATLQGALKGTEANPELQGQISIADAALSPLPDVPLTNLKGKISFSNDKANLESLAGTAFGSPFTLTARIAHFDRPELVLEGDWARLAVDRVLTVFSSTPSTQTNGAPPPSDSSAPIARADGVFRIREITHPHYLGRNFVFCWNLTDLGPNLSVLSGSATVTAAEGEIRDVPVARKINKLLNRNQPEITYKRLNGQFLITRGLVDIRPFLLDSDQTDFRAEGTVRLGDRTSDLRLMLKLPPGSVPGNVGDWMTAEDGRPTIEASLKGPLADPTVKVNRKDILRRAAQDILKKTIGGWKGKPDPTPLKEENPPAPESIPSPPPKDPLKDMGNALKNIWKKAK